MVHNDWKLADRNIQYRVLNAMIKERIFSDSTLIHQYDTTIEIQYHGHLLTIEVLRRNALARYDFNGDIQYKCGKEVNTITSLETLLDILKNKFDIAISSRLYQELVHSRDSLNETYKQMTNRQLLIKGSFKFSHLPEGINFFSWLQHLNKHGYSDDLSYSESLVVEGHPTHPLTKTKLPLTMEEVAKYSPEFEKEIPLEIMLIEQQYIQSTAINDEQQYILNHVIPEYYNKLRVYMKNLGLNVGDYRVVLVHPWQYQHTIAKHFKTWVAQKILIPTPFTVKSKATLSFRTMSLIGKPFHVKLPVNVQATSAVRTVSPVTTVDGPRLSEALQDMLNQFPKLKVALEPFGTYADTGDDLARQLACIIRQKPKLEGPGSTIVTASLVNENPVDKHVVVDSYLEWLEDGVTAQNIKTFISVYAETLITPLIAFIQDYGIALEAHMQNTVVRLGPDYDMAFLVRDLGGSRIDLATLQQRIPDITVENDSLIADSIEEVIAKFQHAVIQNQLAELIHHFNQYDFVDEQILFDIVREKVEAAIDSDNHHAEALKKILFGPTIRVKALLNMRMESKVKQYLNIDLDNPIKKEV